MIETSKVDALKCTVDIFKEVINDKRVLKCMSRLSEYDKNTYWHSVRVCEFSLFIGKRMNMKDKDLLTLGYAAILHDIGKTMVDIDIIAKPDKLTDLEMVEVRKHPIYGSYLLLDLGLPNRAMRAIVEHHEKLDGTGYPFGLRGREICIEARIISIADIFDAVTYTRPYTKKAMSNREAVDMLYSMTGVDSRYVEALQMIV